MTKHPTTPASACTSVPTATSQHVQTQLSTAINDFFYKNPPNEFSSRLWEIAGYAMGNKEMDSRDNIDRGNFIYFLRDVDMLIWASLNYFSSSGNMDKQIIPSL